MVFDFIIIKNKGINIIFSSEQNLFVAKNGVTIDVARLNTSDGSLIEAISL